MSGESKRALQRLDEVLSALRLTSAGFLRIHPGWDGFRDDRRFQELLEKYAWA